MTSILDIEGAFAGDFIANTIFEVSGKMFHFWPLVFSVGGVFILLWLYGIITKKNS